MESALKPRFCLIVFAFICSASGENDWNLCGTWRHGDNPLTLAVNISTGCHTLTVSANQSSLSVAGQFTVHCSRFDVIDLSKQFGLDPSVDTPFCLFWEPSLDQLKLEIGGNMLSLCWPKQLLDFCCSDLSNGPNAPEGKYGISGASIKSDGKVDKTFTSYTFKGQLVAYTTLCDEWNRSATQVNRIGDHLCPRTSVLDPRGKDSIVNFTESVSAEPSVVVYIPPTFQHHVKHTSNVVITSFKRNTLFKPAQAEGVVQAQVIDDVVEITVENEIVADLTDPITIDFYHNVIERNYSRKCVSWDTNKDPLQVNWLLDGCETLEHGGSHTECRCNHLTYFSILVQLEARPVHHLLALTVITSLGCAVSLICCIALIVHLCMKSRRSKEQSIPIHLGLASSLASLYLIFFLTPILANVGNEPVCLWVAPLLHYALLTSLTWMSIEVFHTFWLVYMVFSPSPRPLIWNVIGFVLPAGPVLILISVGDIYGLREVHQQDDPSKPFLMCWMKSSSKAMLAHYCTNMTLLGLLFCSGLVMLCMVYRQIRTRDEWKQNRVAFFSIWGLSCLFGTSWCLTFLDIGSLSPFVLFLSCILNSFQGLMLMLRFCMLDWIRKHTSGSFSRGSSSSGSTRQHMLQPQEKC